MKDLTIEEMEQVQGGDFLGGFTTALTGIQGVIIGIGVVAGAVTLGPALVGSLAIAIAAVGIARGIEEMSLDW